MRGIARRSPGKCPTPPVRRLGCSRAVKPEMLELKRSVVAVTGLAVLMLVPAPARAWEVGSQLNYHGCHEPITAAALRAARAVHATAPVIAPTSDEMALFADVQFEP